MEATILPEEKLARFIFSSSHFSSQNFRVKHNAFLPTSAGEASVSRISDLPEPDIWPIGSVIATQRGQTLYARGDLLAHDVRQVQLDVTPAEPPPRHANIVNWPTDKSAQKLRAMELAEKAKLVMLS